jgi:hypothetical protein
MLVEEDSEVKFATMKLPTMDVLKISDVDIPKDMQAQVQAQDIQDHHTQDHHTQDRHTQDHHTLAHHTLAHHTLAHPTLAHPTQHTQALPEAPEEDVLMRISAVKKEVATSNSVSQHTSKLQWLLPLLFHSSCEKSLYTSYIDMIDITRKPWKTILCHG